jgi:hypothetical protein
VKIVHDSARNSPFTSSEINELEIEAGQDRRIRATIDSVNFDTSAISVAMKVEVLSFSNAKTTL